MDEAIAHCTRGIGIWPWASHATAAASPTWCSAAPATCRRSRPSPPPSCCAGTCRTCAVRVVNVVDLMRLQPDDEHPHGHVATASSTRSSPRTGPVIFAYHGYPWLIHRLTYRRTNHANLHVRGYKEEGTTTTPFDMVMMNDLDRFHLVIDVIDRVPGLGQRAAALRQRMVDRRLALRALHPRDRRGPPRRGGVAVEPRPAGHDVTRAARRPAAGRGRRRGLGDPRGPARPRRGWGSRSPSSPSPTAISGCGATSTRASRGPSAAHT